MRAPPLVRFHCLTLHSFTRVTSQTRWSRHPCTRCVRESVSPAHGSRVTGRARGGSSQRPHKKEQEVNHRPFRGIYKETTAAGPFARSHRTGGKNSRQVTRDLLHPAFVLCKQRACVQAGGPVPRPDVQLTRRVKLTRSATAPCSACHAVNSRSRWAMCRRWPVSQESSASAPVSCPSSSKSASCAAAADGRKRARNALTSMYVGTLDETGCTMPRSSRYGGTAGPVGSGSAGCAAATRSSACQLALSRRFCSRSPRFRLRDRQDLGALARLARRIHLACPGSSTPAAAPHRHLAGQQHISDASTAMMTLFHQWRTSRTTAQG